MYMYDIVYEIEKVVLLYRMCLLFVVIVVVVYTDQRVTLCV